MNDLFAQPKLTREAFNSRGLSVLPVLGDGMSPTLRGGWDYVLVSPLNRFLYDSVYVVEEADQPCIYRAQSMGTGQIGLLNDNPAYGATAGDRMHLVSRDWFEEHVLGIVVCDLKVRDADLMQRAVAA
jgi:hypothetical protein